MEEKYNAGLMSQSFWFIEFKKIVLLYHEGNDYNEIKRQCIEENLLGAINPYREKRMCGYLLSRLRSMDERLVEIFINSDISNQKLINFITIMNTNKLFLDFVYEVYRKKLIIGENNIDLKDANIFFSQKESQNEDLASWKESTKKKLRSLFLNLLIEADLVKWADDKKKNRTINRVFVGIPLENYLKSTNLSIYKAITGEN